MATPGADVCRGVVQAVPAFSIGFVVFNACGGERASPARFCERRFGVWVWVWDVVFAAAQGAKRTVGFCARADCVVSTSPPSFTIKCESDGAGEYDAYGDAR